MYYYRAIVPKHLKSELGLSEIKRSLNTKEPTLAKLYAQYLNLTLRTGLLGYQKLLSLNEDNLIKIQKMANNFTEFGFSNIRTLTVTTPDGIKLEADPNILGDVESVEKIVLSLARQRFSLSHFVEQDIDVHGSKMNVDMARWIARLATENQKNKTIDEYVSKVDTFRKYVHNIEVHKITPKQVSEFINDLSSGKITGEALSPSTINKYITALNSFFNFALRDGAWPEHKPLPTNNQRIKKTRNTKSKSYLPFERQDLNKIFNPQSIYWKNIGGHDFRPHMLWLPLLALFTGARIEELCQLSINNIYQDDDSVWIIDINEEENRQLKTVASIRKTPLHPMLIALGFLDYLDDVKNNFGNEKLIFPYLTQNKYGKYSDPPSKWFGRYLDKLEITDERKVFHSFRSTANNVLKEAEVGEETRCQMIGHEYSSTNSRNYSKTHTPKWLLEHVIPKLQYPNIDFSELAYQKGSHVSIITKLLASKRCFEKHKKALALP